MYSKRLLPYLGAGIVGVFFLISQVVPANADMRKAKKEGEVVWYSALRSKQAQKVCNFFTKKKLGIKCTLARMGSGKIYRRYLEESKAGIRRADVFHSSNIGHFINLKKKKKFRAYQPKETGKFDPAYLTDDGSWTILRSFAMVPHYNPKKVKASDVPKSWKDFINPNFKKRLVHSHPSFSGATATAMIGLVKLFGWGFYKDLADLKPLIVNSGGAPPGMVARGEADLGVGGATYTVFSQIKKGEPLKMIFPKEGVPFIYAANATLKEAPHPNAADVFVDYLFSKEVQQMLANFGLYVGHPEVVYPKGLPPLKSLKRINVPPMEIKKKTKTIRKKFREIFGV